MNRLAGRILALAALLALPTLASAQKEPPDTKEVKDAQKYLGLAMMQQAQEKKIPLYLQAMKSLEAGMAKTPDNAKVWMYAGQVYAGMGDFVGADSAFRRAQQLYPGYAEDISNEREAAWVEAFNQGITLMDQKDTDGAIKKLEQAEMLYPLRPESKMNLGALYASKNDIDKAIAMFEKAIESANGPLKEKLKPEDAANWKRFADLARSNIAQLIGARGVEEFNAEKYDEAFASFTKAAEINPFSRDYLYNRAQALYAKATKLEDQRTALVEAEAALKKTKGQEAAAKVKADSAAALAALLVPIYAQIVEASERTRTLDPQNESLFHLAARSYKLTGDMTTDAAAKANWQAKALATLTQREALEFEVIDVAVQAGEADVTVRGNVKNIKAAPNTPIKLKFTLIGIDGTPLGSQEVTVSAPAVNQNAAFEVKMVVQGEIAGWKYEVVK